MRIQTRKQIEALQSALDQCRMPVWLISSAGEQFNLKKDDECYMGIARLLRDKNEDLELFTSIPHDEMIMMNFYADNCVFAR